MTQGQSWDKHDSGSRCSSPTASILTGGPVAGRRSHPCSHLHNSNGATLPLWRLWPLSISRQRRLGPVGEEAGGQTPLRPLCSGADRSEAP
ncbi:hypothetical protein IG631_07887 [Alternaria alternata]|nr:hypothetical protein IG631_07887 [Alternaria alternata]